MSPSSVPITKNHGFYGVKDNELVTDDDDLESLVKYYNRERAGSITEENPLKYNIDEWKFDDWYGKNPSVKQRDTSHLEEALEKALKREGVIIDPVQKFPIFFGSGNMTRLLSPLLFDSSSDYAITKFNFNDKTGLRFKVSKKVEKVKRSVVGQHGHIVERFVTSEENEENKDKRIEIGRKLTYLINSLEFPGSGVILFSSKEFDCLLERKDYFDANDACEVKAFDLDHDRSGIRKKLLVVKNFALGGIQKFAMTTISEDFTTISKFEVKDIKKLDEDKTLESFCACLNKFTKLIVRHCRENELTGGSVETFRLENSRFMVIKDEKHFWCYLFDNDSKDFSGGLKFPNSLSAIRWPLGNEHTRFDSMKINIKRYSFYGQDSDRALRHEKGNCLLVVRKENELNLDKARDFEYKISMKDPIFPLVKKLLLERYYEDKLNERKRTKENEKEPDWKRWR